MEIKISLCIPTYKRFLFLVESLPKYLKNKYIDEIVICDEDGEDYELIDTYFGNEPRIKLYKNQEILGPFLNKEKCVNLSNNDWVCIIDSDNYASESYFESWLNFIKENHINPKNIYCPSFTLPSGNFDFRFMINREVTIKNAKTYWNIHNFGSFLNVGNYIVNKDEFLSVKNIIYSKDCLVDVLYRNVLMLQNGCKLIAVPEMSYIHTRHNGSFYLNNMNNKLMKEINEKIDRMILDA